jgi:hypothetical protein
LESIALRLAGDMSKVMFDALAAQVVEKAKQCILDQLGVQVRGATLPQRPTRLGAGAHHGGATGEHHCVCGRPHDGAICRVRQRHVWSQLRIRRRPLAGRSSWGRHHTGRLRDGGAVGSQRTGRHHGGRRRLPGDGALVRADPSCEVGARVASDEGGGCLWSGAAIGYPSDAISAQFSLAFSVGLRLVKGSNALSLYMDPAMWKDPDVLEVGATVSPGCWR